MILIIFETSTGGGEQRADPVQVPRSVRVLRVEDLLESHVLVPQNSLQTHTQVRLSHPCTRSSCLRVKEGVCSESKAVEETKGGGSGVPKSES